MLTKMLLYPLIISSLQISILEPNAVYVHIQEFQERRLLIARDSSLGILPLRQPQELRSI